MNVNAWLGAAMLAAAAIAVSGDPPTAPSDRAAGNHSLERTAAIPDPSHRDQGAQQAAVVRTYLVISGLFTLSASMIWGVNSLFLLDAGLSIFEVFIVGAAFTAGMVLFEVPTGVVADTTGRRRSFLLSTVTLLLGDLGYPAIAVVGGGLVPFIGASLVIGLGYSFYSGAVEAWLVDALRADGYRGQLERVFARGQMVSGAAMLIGSVGGGLLGSVDLTWPFLMRALLLAAVFVVGMRAMHDLGFTPRTTRWSAMPEETMRVLRESARIGWRSRPIRLLMAVSLFQGVFLMWGFYAWQPYFLELLGRNAVWVAGVVAALTALATIAGNGLVEFLTRFCGRRTTLLLGAGGVLGLAAAGIGLAQSFWLAVALLLLVNVAHGVALPVQQAYLHDTVASSQRATVASSISLVNSAGGVGGQVALGYVARAESIAAGYVVGGLATLLVLPPLMLLRRMSRPADIIAGRKAGAQGGCAAQGLPAVSAIDTVPRHTTPEPSSSLVGSSR